MENDQTQQPKNLPATEAGTGQQHSLTGTEARLFDQEQRDRRMSQPAQEHPAPTSYGFGPPDVPLHDESKGVDPQTYSVDGTKLEEW
jgi:hypothetical protein